MLNIDEIHPRLHQIGPFANLVCDAVAALTPDQIAEMKSLLSRWAALPLHNEQTWVQVNHGVPTLIARFDCTLSPKGKLCYFEIEDRPQGLGVTGSINRLLHSRLTAMLEEWPRFTSVESPGHASEGTDDALWAEHVSLEDCPSEGLVLVRSLLSDVGMESLASRSIAPIRSEGRKDYGAELGWWKKVSRSEELPWRAQFVLKPLQGCRSEEVLLWLGEDSHGEDIASRAEIEQALETGPRWLQRYYRPPAYRLDERRHRLLLRPFFGYSPSQKEWVYLGGAWLLSPHFKIHGSADTIVGSLV